VFKNLRTSTKLAILCTMFMIAIGVTTDSLVREKLIAIEFARRELAGARYLTTIRELFETVLERQPFIAVATQPVDPPRDLLGDLAKAQGNGDLSLHTGKLSGALATSLQSWSSNSARGAAPAVALDTIDAAQELATRIADNSNLTLDPDLDSYYVQNLVAEKLPAFLRLLGEMQIVQREIAAAGTASSEQSVRAEFLAGRLRASADEIKERIAAAYRGNADGGLRKAVDTAFASMVLSAGAYLEGLNGSDDRGRATSLELVASDGLYSRAVAETVGAWKSAELELDRLLQERIDRLLGRMHSSLALIATLVALSVLVAIMIYLHVVRPLKRLENVASTVRDSKDYSLRIDYSSKDEIGSVVSAFNTMLAELAAAHERERSEQSELARVARLTTMGAMTASIAHEINQPLAAIVANSSAAQRFLSLAPPDLEEVRGALRDIANDGQRASQVIGSVRAIFKRENQGKGRLAVNDVIEDILTLVRGEIRKHGVVVKCDLSPSLPYVEADRTQLQQVLMNLIMNAVEAMASLTDRERRLAVRSGVLDDKNIVIAIEDSGAGISLSDKDRIFDAFYTTKSEGMGMGLFICRSIVESHGGRLSASPGEHCGSVFQVVLPSSE